MLSFYKRVFHVSRQLILYHPFITLILLNLTFDEQCYTFVHIHRAEKMYSLTGRRLFAAQCGAEGCLPEEPC